MAYIPSIRGCGFGYGGDPFDEPGFRLTPYPNADDIALPIEVYGNRFLMEGDEDNPAPPPL